MKWLLALLGGVPRAQYDGARELLDFWRTKAGETATMHDEVTRALTVRAETAERLLSESMHRYHELRMHGADAPLPRPQGTGQRREADMLVQAINARTAGRPAVRALALEQLKRDRANKIDDTDILKRIEAGSSLADFGLPA